MRLSETVHTFWTKTTRHGPFKINTEQQKSQTGCWIYVMQIEGCQKTFKDLTEAGESLITIIIAIITMITALKSCGGFITINSLTRVSNRIQIEEKNVYCSNVSQVLI